MQRLIIFGLVISITLVGSAWSAQRRAKGNRAAENAAKNNAAPMLSAKDKARLRRQARQQRLGRLPATNPVPADPNRPDFVPRDDLPQPFQNRAANQAEALQKQMNQLVSAIRKGASKNQAALQSEAVRRQVSTLARDIQQFASENKANRQAQALTRQMNTVIRAIQQQAAVNRAQMQARAVNRRMGVMFQSANQLARRPATLIRIPTANQAAIQSRAIRRQVNSVLGRK